jgi:hypothetical protein
MLEEEYKKEKYRRVLELSEDEFSAALDCLYNDKDPTPELCHLNKEDWLALGYLLNLLLAEKRLSQVH